MPKQQITLIIRSRSSIISHDKAAKSAAELAALATANDWDVVATEVVDANASTAAARTTLRRITPAVVPAAFGRPARRA